MGASLLGVCTCALRRIAGRPRRLLLLALLLAGASSAASASQDQPCTLTDDSGFYDLRPLQRKGSDYTVKDAVSGAEYHINFCSSVFVSTWNVPDSDKIGAYSEGTRSGISLGQFNSTPSYRNGALTLMYGRGSNCPNSATQRTSVIYLECSDGGYEDTAPRLVSDVDECAYFFAMRTSHACPVSIYAGIGTAFVAFFSFLAIGGAVSLLSAVAYNRFVLKKIGREQIPSLGIVFSAFDFLKDMFVICGIWLLDRMQSLWEPLLRKRGGYGGVDYASGAWAQTNVEPPNNGATPANGAPKAGTYRDQDDDEHV